MNIQYLGVAMIIRANSSLPVKQMKIYQTTSLLLNGKL